MSSTCVFLVSGRWVGNARSLLRAQLLYHALEARFGVIIVIRIVRRLRRLLHGWGCGLKKSVNREDLGASRALSVIGPVLVGFRLLPGFDSPQLKKLSTPWSSCRATPGLLLLPAAAEKDFSLQSCAIGVAPPNPSRAFAFILAFHCSMSCAVCFSFFSSGLASSIHSGSCSTLLSRLQSLSPPREWPRSLPRQSRDRVPSPRECGSWS